LRLEEHTIRGRFSADLLALILLLRAGSASFLDQSDLLFVGQAMDVPQMLPATLGSFPGEALSR
jgi:hypothetical protein